MNVDFAHMSYPMLILSTFVLIIAITPIITAVLLGIGIAIKSVREKIKKVRCKNGNNT